MSREYTGHWSRVAATVTLVSAGWEPLRVGSPKPQVPSCPSRSDPRKPEVSPPPARASGTVGSPGWVRGPGAAPSWAPAAPAAPSRRRSARTRVGHSGARERRPPGRDAGPRGGAVRWGGAERRQLPGNSNPGSSGAAAPAQPLHSPRSEVSAGAGRAPGGSAGQPKGQRRPGYRGPRSPGRRAARGSYLPAPSRVCAGPLSPGGGGDQRRSMAAAVPPARALCPRLRLGPRPPAAMPGAPAGRAQPPPPERGAAAALSPIESGARRAPSRLAGPGGLPARLSERRPAAPSPTEAAAAK